MDNVHLKDFRAGQFVPLGEGNIDLAQVLAALHEQGFGGWLCADEESGAGVEESLRASSDFLRRGWQAAQEAAQKNQL